METRGSRRKSLLGVPWFGLTAQERLFAAQKLACVYAVGPVDAQRPIKVGWTGSPLNRFVGIQVGNPLELKLFDVVWVAGAPVAKRLEKESHRILEQRVRRIRGEWFDASVSDVLPAIQVALDNLKVPALTHDGMLETIEQEFERRLQAAVDADLRPRRLAA